MMDNTKPRGRGRPGKSEDEKRQQLYQTVPPEVAQRFERLVPKDSRSEFLEQALTLMLDIKEGKRDMPPLNP